MMQAALSFSLLLFILLEGCSSFELPNYALPDGFEDIRSDSSLRITFYNVENLFDTTNDPITDDDAFTPGGLNRWTYSRYRAKINEHAQTIRAIGGWSAPEIVAFAEIENEGVLLDLITSEPLKPFAYKTLHFNSPDPRGIDVALIYRSDRIYLDSVRPIPLRVDSLDRPLRDFLWCRWKWKEKYFQTLFMHWPSRYGGQKSSEEKRFLAGSQVNHLKKHIDSLIGKEPWILMGDLNDEPNNRSIREYLGTEGPSANWINLMDGPNEWPGTHVYEGRWNYLDHCLLSMDFNSTESEFNVAGVKIFSARWLLEENEQGFLSPFRTYLGPAYHGGASDHLPIYIDLYLK